MPTIEILCPWHGVKEEVDLPDIYSHAPTFEGEIPCGHAAPSGRLTVRVVVHFSGRTVQSVTKVEKGTA